MIALKVRIYWKNEGILSLSEEKVGMVLVRAVVLGTIGGGILGFGMANARGRKRVLSEVYVECRGFGGAFGGG